MAANAPNQDANPGVSKLKLALGAASLFLFIVGVKRTFRTDEGPGGVRLSDEPAPDEPRRNATPAGR